MVNEHDCDKVAMPNMPVTHSNTAMRPEWGGSGSHDARLRKSLNMSPGAIRSLDPRHSLAARVGWMFLLLSTIFAAGSGFLASASLRAMVESDIGSLYASRAKHIANAIDWNIERSAAATQLAATVIGASTKLQDRAAQQKLVEAMQKNLPEAAWVGVVDTGGGILDSSPSDLSDASFGERPWFRAALNHPVSVGPEPLAQARSATSKSASDQRPEYLIVAAPIPDGSGGTRGVVIALFGLDWVARLARDADAKSQQVRPAQLLILGADGEALFNTGVGSLHPGNAGLLAAIDRERAQSPGQSKGYFISGGDLLGYSIARSPEAPGAGNWSIVVSEPAASAFAPANMAVTKEIAAFLLVGLALSIMAFFGTHLLLRRLTRIAEVADAMRIGNAGAFPRIDGSDEAARISRSIALLFDQLRTSNLQLADFNQNLERKVEERSDEVRKLSEEVGKAAVTEERLRISRDLHDTLAHSMVAILTQLRYVQKLHRLRPDEVGNELQRAETVAREGLGKAREAVAKLRYAATHGENLEQALRKLVTGTRERTKLDVELDVDVKAAALSGPLAEGAYRIAEEALRNVELHSGAKAAKVKATVDAPDHDAGALRLLVEDNGRGFDVASATPDRFGILGMQEQAAALAGSVEIKSNPGSGTQVTLHIPI